RRHPHAHVLPAVGVLRLEPLGDPHLTTDFRDDAEVIEMLDHIPWRHNTRALSNPARPGPTLAGTPVRAVALTLPKTSLIGQSKLRNGSYTSTKLDFLQFEERRREE